MKKITFDKKKKVNQSDVDILSKTHVNFPRFPPLILTCSGNMFYYMLHCKSLLNKF